MNKNTIKKLIITAMFFFIIICINNKVSATTINVSPSSPKVGDTVTITVSVPNVNTASVTANVSGVVSGTIKVVGGDLNGAATSYSKSESFYCSSEGKITIAVSSDSTAVLNGEYVNVGASTTVNVAAEKNNTTTNNDTNTNGNSNGVNSNNGTSTANTTTEAKKSSNANLANLGITPNDFRGFKSGTTAYNATVPNDVEQVSVYAKVQDSKAKITSGTGKQKLNVGANQLKVVVTAEDGTTKTYTINVTREEAAATTNKTEDSNTTENQTAENEQTNEQSNSDLIKLEIEGYSLTPKFSPDIYEYKLDLHDDVDSLKVLTEGANHDISIEVIGNTEIKDGENTITVLVRNEETKQNSTYQITVNKQVAPNTQIDDNLNSAIKKANKVRTILLAIVAFIIIAIIVFIVVRHRYNQDNSDNYDAYDYDSEDKERLNLEEEELFKRVNKKEFEKKAKKRDIEVKEDDTKNDKEANVKVLEKPERIESHQEQEEEGEEEFFRTSRSKPKGKHF